MFDEYVGNFYEECPASEASLVVLDYGGPYYAGHVYHDTNGNISYQSKDGGGGVVTGNAEADFRGTKHVDGTAVYYKLKN